MGKEPPEELKYAIFKNWLGTRPKMETNEPNVYPTILEGVSLGFWSPFEDLGARSAIFLALENGHFCQKYQANFWKLQILAPLGALFPLWWTQTQKLMAGYRLWVYNSEIWFLGSPNLSAPLVFWALKNSKVGQKRYGLISTATFENCFVELISPSLYL